MSARSAEVFLDDDADLSIIQRWRVGIIGYGSQGHVHSLKLRDSCVEVKVGLKEGSKSRAKIAVQGLEVDTPGEVAKWADVVMLLASDTALPEIYENDIKPNLQDGDALLFDQGLPIYLGMVKPQANITVGLVAQTMVRYQDNGVSCLIAVDQDPKGEGQVLTLSYAKAIGGTSAGVITTTFRDKAEAELLAKHNLPAGRIKQFAELAKAAFESKVTMGRPPQLAYVDVQHQLKLIRATSVHRV